MATVRTSMNSNCYVIDLYADMSENAAVAKRLYALWCKQDINCVSNATLTSTEATHCSGQSPNIPTWALPFYHATPSTSRLCNQCFPLNGMHSQFINPCWTEAGLGKPGTGWWGLGKWEWRDVLVKTKPHTHILQTFGSLQCWEQIA